MSSEPIAGELHQYEVPDRASLVSCVGDDGADDFTWMCEFALLDAARVQTYKHRATRRYVYLAGDGRAFARTAAGAYMETEPGGRDP